MGACLFRIVTQWRLLDFLDFFDFLELMKEAGVLGVVEVEVAWGVGLIVGGGGVDVSEDADLSGGEDDGLGCGGDRWWVRYRFARVCQELWEDFPNSLPLFFNFCRNVFLISLKRRSDECGWGVYWRMCWSVGEFETWFILKWEVIVRFRNGCEVRHEVMLVGWGIFSWNRKVVLLIKLKDAPGFVDGDWMLGKNRIFYRIWDVDLSGAFRNIGQWN